MSSIFQMNVSRLEMKYIKPFAVQIWSGESKPSVLNEFLAEFVSEMKRLMTNGLDVNGHHINIFFRCCICDSPARAFVKGTVCFNHRFGCQKCMVIGKYLANRMSFPHINCMLRTDSAFRNRLQPIHHKTDSLFEDLEIDMVADFPTSDPLHLLELGMMKRFAMNGILKCMISS